MPGFDNDCLFFGGGIDPRGLDPISNPVVNQMSNGKILIGSDTAPYVIANTITPPSEGISVSGGAGTITIGLEDDLNAIESLSTTGLVSRTATDTWSTNSITQNAVLYGGTGQTVSNLGPLSLGQFVMGNNSSAPVAGEIHTGIGVSVSVSTSAITIGCVNGSFSWSEVTSSTATLAVQHAYVTNRSGGVTYTLPASADLGNMIYIIGKSGITSIAQNNGQQIFIGNTNTTAGTGGSLTATNLGDCILLACISSGSGISWRAISAWGNWTVV